MGQNSLTGDGKRALIDSTAEVAVVIVGFRNPADIVDCLTAISSASLAPNFDVFICENGGPPFYRRLVEELAGSEALCTVVGDLPAPSLSTTRFVEVMRFRFRNRPSNIWVGCAADNLGYAGGINAWTQPLLKALDWKGLWILNPDTVPREDALAALVERAEVGGKGMVGSTILDLEEPVRVRFRGGLHWQRLASRGVSIGLNERLDAPHDLSEIEDAMDSPSGASMYVTRRCIETIGLMDESYFLFFEDLDWGVRAKPTGLGYASKSIVAHKRGTATGSARGLAAMPKLSVYLQQRNGIHFVRKHFPWSLPLQIVTSCLYAARFLRSGATSNLSLRSRGYLPACGERSVGRAGITRHPKMREALRPSLAEHQKRGWPLFLLLVFSLPMNGAWAQGEKEVGVVAHPTSQTAWPDEGNSGVPAGTTLKPSGSIVITEAGAVVSGLDIRGTVDINASNVKLMNSRIRGARFDIVRIKRGAENVVVQDCEIDGVGTDNDGSNGIRGAGTFLRNNIYHVENGITLDGSATIEGNYIHDLLASGSPHYDGIQIDGGISDVTIRRNTVINPYTQTSAVMIDNYFGPISNITVEQNRLIGGGYSVYSDGQFNGGTISGVSFVENRLGKGHWGYRSVVKNTPVWRGNVDDVTGRDLTYAK